MTDLLQLDDQIRACTKCDLCKGRKQAVPGDGPATAEIVFVGEAPGYHEDQQGKPFVGPAGQFLNELLASVGLRRQDVLILNVIKCRPPQNRDPLPNELLACDEWLTKQFAFLHPRVVVTLGRFSMAKFFPGETISRIHGQPRRRDGVVYLPLYHPAAALHQARYKTVIEADFKQIPRLLAEARRQVAVPPPSQPARQEAALQAEADKGLATARPPAGEPQPTSEPAKQESAAKKDSKDSIEPRQLSLF